MNYYILLIISLFLVSCNINKEDPEDISEKWTDSIRGHIIQSVIKANPNNFNQILDNTIKNININKSAPLESAELQTEVMQAQDTCLMYITQRRSNGMRCFNAILINRAFYGTVEWYNEKGTWSKVGQYFNDIPCGKWTYYGENKNIDSVIDKGNEDLLLKLKTDTVLNKFITK